MSTKFVINKDLIAYLRTASNMSTKEFADALGVDPKSVRAYTEGEYLPRKPAVIAKLQKLALKHGAGEIASTPSLNTPKLPEGVSETTLAPAGEFAPEVLKALQDREGLDGKQMAAQLGIAASTWYHWLAGTTKPRFSKHEKILRKALKAKAQETPAPVVADSPFVKGGKRQVSTELFHELGHDFHAHYQPRLDEAAIDYALTLVCEKFQENRRDLRRKVAALLFLLKDRVSPEDLFTNLSGHSSSS
jgi:transcriptional regulator with XRE-family HTH domain